MVHLMTLCFIVICVLVSSAVSDVLVVDSPALVPSTTDPAHSGTDSTTPPHSQHDVNQASEDDSLDVEVDEASKQATNEEPVVVKEEEPSSILQMLLDILPLDAYAERVMSQVKNHTQGENNTTKNETKTKTEATETETHKLPPSNPKDPNIIYGIPDTSIPSLAELSALPPTSPYTLLSNVRDKFNYASMDCGANVLSVNREAKEATGILVGSKDRYMLSPCGVSRRYVVLELCEELGIQILALANYEFFSSMLKDFQVYGTNRYPTKQWIPLGNFTAQNVRRLQYFVLPEPLWFKYIRIQFITHYGDEYYCPISELRIHGTTVVDDITLQIERDSREISELANALRSPFRVYQPPAQQDIKAISNYHPPIHRHTPEPDDDEDDPIDSSKNWDSLLSDTGDLLKGLEDTFKQSLQRFRSGLSAPLEGSFAADNGEYCTCGDENCDCGLYPPNPYKPDVDVSQHETPHPADPAPAHGDSQQDRAISPETKQDPKHLPRESPLIQESPVDVSHPPSDKSNGDPPKTRQELTHDQLSNLKPDDSKDGSNEDEEQPISGISGKVDQGDVQAHQEVPDTASTPSDENVAANTTLTSPQHPQLDVHEIPSNTNSGHTGEDPLSYNDSECQEIELLQSLLSSDDTCLVNITHAIRIKQMCKEHGISNDFKSATEEQNHAAPEVTHIQETKEAEPHSTDSPVQAARRRTRETVDNEQTEPISEKYSNLGFALGSSPQTIFKTLIMRIKTLEINQSIAAVYLAELTSSYAEAFSSMYRTFSRLDAANSDLLNLVQDTSKKTALKNKILAKEVDELKMERILMMSNISVLANQIRVLAEATEALKSKQDTQQWINILIASILGALVVGVVLRPTTHNTNIPAQVQKQKTKTSPVLKLSRSVGAGINVFTTPEIEKQGSSSAGGTPKTRRRRHSIGHSLSPFRTRKNHTFPTEENESDSNSDWEMDADDEISNKYFKNEEGGGSEGELTTHKEENKGLARGIKERVFPYLIKKSASTSTIDTKYEPDLLRFLFM